MSLGDVSLLKPGTPIFAGAQRGTDGKFNLVFVFCGLDGVVPAL
jgi:hypothetical protein